MTLAKDHKRFPGRPQQTTQVRDALICHARTLFIYHPYEKVSTRMIASHAGVNMGMIRYYFNNKAGLFETMLRETLTPTRQVIAECSIERQDDFFLTFMSAFYQAMAKHKNFLQFVRKTMQLSANMPQRQITERVILEHIPYLQEKLKKALSVDGVLKEGVDINFTYFTILNLMMFPFIAPPEILKLHNIVIDDDFLFSLLKHNAKLIKQGIIN
ncbi:MAG: TetR/AcrR family transcriptional regulator [Colwellia sp.]